MIKYRSKSAVIAVVFLVILNILAVLSLFCSYAAQYIDPREAWIFALFGLVYPWILIVNIAFVVLWLILWKKYAILSIIAILIGWNHLTTIIRFDYNSPVLLPGRNFSVITYNVHGFLGQENANRDVQKEIIEFLAKERPTILCLQEFRIRKAQIKPILRNMASAWQLPYWTVEDYYHTNPMGGLNGFATFSAYPVVHKGTLSYKDMSHFAIFSDIVMDQDTFRIFNMHLASLRLGKRDVDFYYQLKNTETENMHLKDGIFSILRKLKTAFRLRASQTEILLDAIQSSPYPVLLCGDMNDSPFSYTYRRLTEKLKDAYREAGEGFLGNTYDGALPNYRIDYILHGKHFKACLYKKMNVTFSDHYPVSGLLHVLH
ncbi:MAG: endonuclease/exonuclease/phosphatase family protein [bacterium]